jgi:hypothetical protein
MIECLRLAIFKVAPEAMFLASGKIPNASFKVGPEAMLFFEVALNI